MWLRCAIQTLLCCIHDGRGRHEPMTVRVVGDASLLALLVDGAGMSEA
jgi:hypothetical protein